jgi:hypothetical protein
LFVSGLKRPPPLQVKMLIIIIVIVRIALFVSTFIVISQYYNLIPISFSIVGK